MITRLWYTPKLFGLLFFCIAWDAFLVFWYALAIKGGSLFAMIFPIAHVAVGVGLTYSLVAGFLNRTRIRVSPMEIGVRHSPVPWAGNKTIPRNEVEQLFCEYRGGKSPTYDVSVILSGGRRTKLVTGLETPDQALYVEQRLEDFLGIADRPVVGEMAGATPASGGLNTDALVERAITQAASDSSRKTIWLARIGCLAVLAVFVVVGLTSNRNRPDKASGLAEAPVYGDAYESKELKTATPLHVSILGDGFRPLVAGDPDLYRYSLYSFFPGTERLSNRKPAKITTEPTMPARASATAR